MGSIIRTGATVAALVAGAGLLVACEEKKKQESVTAHWCVKNGKVTKVDFDFPGLHSQFVSASVTFKDKDGATVGGPTPLVGSTSQPTDGTTSFAPCINVPAGTTDFEVTLKWTSPPGNVVCRTLTKNLKTDS